MSQVRVHLSVADCSAWAPAELTSLTRHIAARGHLQLHKFRFTIRTAREAPYFALCDLDLDWGPILVRGLFLKVKFTE